MVKKGKKETFFMSLTVVWRNTHGNVLADTFLMLGMWNPSQSIVDCQSGCWVGHAQTKLLQVEEHELQQFQQIPSQVKSREAIKIGKRGHWIYCLGSLVILNFLLESLLWSFLPFWNRCHLLFHSVFHSTGKRKRLLLLLLEENIVHKDFEIFLLLWEQFDCIAAEVFSS